MPVKAAETSEQAVTSSSGFKASSAARQNHFIVAWRSCSQFCTSGVCIYEHAHLAYHLIHGSSFRTVTCTKWQSSHAHLRLSDTQTRMPGFQSMHSSDQAVVCYPTLTRWFNKKPVHKKVQH